MKQFTVYANYGVLAAEKRTVWTAEMPHPQAVCSDEHTVKVPDGWGLYKNWADILCVKSPWGSCYTLNEVIAGDVSPCFLAYDSNNKQHIISLEVLD